jgi:hypothetical protein
LSRTSLGLRSRLNATISSTTDDRDERVFIALTSPN